MHGRVFTCAIGTLAAILGAAGPVAARTQIRDAWVAHYPASQSDDNVVAGTGTACQLCHRDSNGGDGWNAYGWSIRQRIDAGDSFDQAFANVEGQDADSDPGAATNLEEIVAHSQPGWTPGAANTIFFKDGSTLTGQSPPGIAGSLDPIGGTTSTTSSSVSTSSSSSTSSTSTTSSSVSTSTSLSTSTTSSTSTSSSTTSSSMPGATSTTSTSSSTSSSTSVTSSSSSSTSTSASTSSSSTSSSSTSSTATSSSTTSSSTSSSVSTTTSSSTTSSSSTSSSTSSSSITTSSSSSTSTSTTTTTTLPGTITLTLAAARDTTLYSESDDLANGAGQHLFAGTTNVSDLRRGLLAFDLSAVPDDAVVISATVTLFVSRTNAVIQTVGLHRVLADWGEGDSDAPAEEGGGAAATAGDATWEYSFWEAQSWATPGGDFEAAPSASTTVAGVGTAAVWSSSTLAADVQAWVDGSEPTHGWLLAGNEGAPSTAKRFDSRENPVPARRPRLTVQFLSSGSTTTTLVSTTTSTTTLPPLVLEPFVDPLPRPAVAQPQSGSAGGAASYRMSIREVQQQLHRDLPPTTVWGFGDGASGASYPGPTIEAASGLPISVTWVNDLREGGSGALRSTHALPVDTCPHGADDQSPRTVVHLHGGHVPAEVDGYPETTLLPGEETVYGYPNGQPSGTLWYHDHALGITRLNVYMGLAGFYLVRDAEEAALGLPAGEFEIPLAIQDRRFDADGSLDYPALWQEHFFGNTILVNGTVWPYLEVTPGKYRFRLLGGSTARTYRLALSNGASFTVIGTDGGLLPAPVAVTSITLAPGERADVVVDFAGYVPGTTLRLVNDAPAPFPGTPGVGVIPDVMELRVVAGAAHTAPLPASLRTVDPLDEEDAVAVREFELRKASDPCTGQVWLINGLGWDDITERPQLGSTEVWSFVNRSGIMHPMHMHLVFFQVLDRQAFEMRDGAIVPVDPRVPPPPDEAGWKDTVRVGPSEIVRVIARFDDYKGRYPYHCHILEHEDHEMMRQFETVLCGDGELDPGEGCDDGNLADGDGCSGVCTDEGTSTSTTLVATTSTTSTTTSTTTTTLPVATHRLSGAKLRLTDRPGKPRKRRLRILSKDEATSLPDTPVEEATLRVLATGGDGFDARYPLPADGWRPLSRTRPERGLRHRSKAGPIRKIVFKAGRRLMIAGRGEALVQSLGSEPEHVQVELRIGDHRYCMEFGGESRFREARRLVRKDASRPAGCPPAP